MKRLAIVAVLALSACTWDQHLAAYPTSQLATGPDPSAAVMVQCDRLGFNRHGEAHRLCVLRGIDRLKIEHGVGYAPIQILPHAFPSLVPPGTITVVPAR